MREVTLASALDAISSNVIATRTQGFQDFEAILGQNESSSKFQSLTDDDFHHVLETLMKIVVKEYEGRPAASKSTVTSRLAAISHSFRTTVTIGVASLRYKTTIEALIEHMALIVPKASKKGHTELVDDYFKALLTILGHRPHLEHLSEKRWGKLVELCQNELIFAQETPASPHDVSDLHTPRQFVRHSRESRAGTPAHGSTGALPRNQPSERSSGIYQRRIDGIAMCLERLLSVRHLSILSVASDSSSIADAVLRPTINSNRPVTQQTCLAILSLILFEAITEDVGLATRTFLYAVYFIRRHWRSNQMSAGVKEQMLVLLLRGQCLLPSLIRQARLKGDVSEFDGLLDRLMTEYRSRPAKDKLGVHDIELDAPVQVQQRRLFSMKSCSAKSSSDAESGWVLLSFVADLFSQLRLSTPKRAPADEALTKRRKIEAPLHSLVNVLSAARPEEALASLQFTVFILGSTDISAGELQNVVDKVCPLLIRDHEELSNWAILVLAMIGEQREAHQAATSDNTWQQIFQIALTRMSTHRVSRLCCHLTDVILRNELVQFAEVSDHLDAILSAVEVSGPALLDEAATAFWVTVCTMYNAHRAANYDNVCKTVLRWLFTVWKPSRAGLARNPGPPVRVITSFLQILVGESGQAQKRDSRRMLRSLSRARFICREDTDLTGYLISDTNDDFGACSSPESQGYPYLGTRIPSKGRRAVLGTICDYLLTELASLLSAFYETAQADKLTLMLIRESLKVCIVSFGLHDLIAAQDLAKARHLLERATHLRNHTADAFLSPDLSSDRLRTITPALYHVFEDLPILPKSSFQNLTSVETGVLRVARRFGKEFWRQLAERQTTSEEMDVDSMSDEESQESRMSAAKQKKVTEAIAHDWLCAYTDQKAFEACLRADLCLASEIADPNALSTDEDGVLPEAISTYLVSLHPTEFLASRPFLDDVYRSKLHIRSHDGARLLQFLADSFEAYEIERCETAMATCVDLMSYLVAQWTTQDLDDDLTDVAGQLYQHFIRFVRRRIAGSHVTTAIAKMLQRVMKQNSEYGRAQGIASARTLLFQILAYGAAKVKFCISQTISAVFGLFILREHDSILDDIEASIPHDPDSLSVTAVRLFLLSQLASSWSTLLRRCIYAIVEATALSADVIPYAHVCLGYLGKALAIEDQHELFKLFVSQILYTWLEQRTVSALPYAVFDYNSLEELVQDCKHEIVAQIVMRGKSDEAEVVSTILGAPFPDLLEETFGKSAAYCIARDSAVAPAVDQQAANAAGRLRSYVGKDTYQELLTQRFSEIVATFFKIVDREDQITKGFQKHARHAAANQAYESMLLIGTSQNTPPVSQQPSFKSTCLIEQLEYVCHRSAYNVDDLWTPALYVYIFRTLLENIQPALGPLHAAAVVRRIRILVSMGGPTGLSNYPIEMALSSLRSYLDNTHSAEDVIGLYRYLLSAGREYLSQSPAFLGGFVISVLGSLKAFMERPQESTTQESVYRATLTNAQQFHAWITEYSLDVIASSRASSRANLKQMIEFASQLREHGSSQRDSPEGELLFSVLADRRLADSYVDEPSRRQILSILSKDFRYAQDRQADVLGEVHDAIKLGPIAWQYFGLHAADPSFKLWILRTLCRSYAATGVIDESFRLEISLRDVVESEDKDEDSLSSVSSAAVIQALYRCVCNNSTAEAGLAERTIQSLLTRADVSGKLEALAFSVPEQALSAMTWKAFFSPDLKAPSHSSKQLNEVFIPNPGITVRTWATEVCIALIDSKAGDDPFLTDLRAALLVIAQLAEEILPYIIHLVLSRESGKAERTRNLLSSQLQQMMQNFAPMFEPQIKHMINAIIYLRTQPLPRESTKMDRIAWLDIDWRLLSDIAVRCKLHKTALLFLELAISSEGKTKGSRRSSAVAELSIPTESLLAIFENMDEKDYYYGVRQPSSLGSMIERLDFEGASFASLVFRGMAFDAEVRQLGKGNSSVNNLVHNLNGMQLSGLAFAVAHGSEGVTVSADSIFDAARRLEKWDIPAPEHDAGPAVNLYMMFQNLLSISNSDNVHLTTDKMLQSAFPLSTLALPNGINSPLYWSSMASLVEIEELLSAKTPQQLQQTWFDLEQRSKWMESASFESIDQVLSSRETLFAVLSKNTNLQQLSNSSPKHVRRLQIESLISSSTISRVHGNLQRSLSIGMTIERLLPECRELGLNVEAAARLEASNVLWEQGQMAPSIQVLQDIATGLDLRTQAIPVGKPEILAKLASRIAEARLEQPEQILASYLEPAVKELRDSVTGDAAGQVFHEFAAFCDLQLKNTDSLEDYNSLRKMRDSRKNDISELDQMIKKAAPSKERETLRAHRSKAKTWYDLENAEFQRLQNGRDALLAKSLAMYLLSLRACDSYDRDATRFSALWLEHYDESIANQAVKSHLRDVSSSKFASLMNQWTSRLLDEETDFQALLSDLILRICVDHPYHAMYNIFLSCKSRGGKDATALSRHAAANHIVDRIKQSREWHNKWVTLHNACVNYQRFATEKATPAGDKLRQGMKLQLRKTSAGLKLEQDVINLRVPPPTMKIAFDKEFNYKNVPTIVKWSSEFSVASGLSAPKIITAVASNGRRYKMLFKAGNDDLRQDAIMEQVFEQVSDLLQAHRETRQRKLGIRSYKVLPLTHTAGVIEFVSNTIPLHEYLLPAHQSHFPNDMKNSAARKVIQDALAANRGIEHRIKEYRKVCEKFHPVLRFFFMERFENPDEWFEKRLAYTRTTAAISMLGHVLGLGDRHGHNILLDEKTGEVVHIDLGVAFEQGRVLQVPEVVPFRLTRDIVDGMGVTKTEGVFRRCCEFTMDALRKESYGIMTILDVLRFDPLYLWSMSPVRQKRLQADRSQVDDDGSEDAYPGRTKAERKENEEAEADRALTVVEKKLSKSLSVEATVNQLIQQATDEKNLALLYSGWAAYV